MYALLQSFRKPSMIQTAPLNDAMRCASPVTAPPPPCVPLEPGMGCDGKGWLFMRVLDPRICVRHMRKTEAVRLIAYFCSRSTALTTTERVYWACPASHMMFSEWSRQQNNHARDLVKFAFLHFSIPSNGHESPYTDTRISPPTFHFLLPSHTPQSAFS
jgi:hypothetical protein